MPERQGPCPEIGEKEKFVKIEIICLRSESMGRKKRVILFVFLVCITWGTIVLCFCYYKIQGTQQVLQIYL